MQEIRQSHIIKLLSHKQEGGLHYSLEQISYILSGIGVSVSPAKLSQIQNGKVDGISNLPMNVFYTSFFADGLRDKDSVELSGMLNVLVNYVRNENLTFPGASGDPDDTYESYVKRMLSFALPRHSLPDSHSQVSAAPNNVFLSSRAVIEKQISLEERLNGATRIQLLNFAATTLLYETVISPDGHHVSARKWYETLLSKGTIFKIILPQAGSFAEADAAKYKMCEPYDTGNSRSVINTMRDKLLQDAKSYPELIQVQFTRCALPYALMIVNYEDTSRNHVKVDLYSPHLSRDSQRRSFIIQQVADQENYDFFFENFNAIWKQCEQDNEELYK